MKVPQLWQKWHTMMAHTSRRESSAPHGMALARLRAGVSRSMYSRSAADTRVSSCGVLLPVMYHAAPHRRPKLPKMKNTDEKPYDVIK